MSGVKVQLRPGRGVGQGLGRLGAGVSSASGPIWSRVGSWVGPIQTRIGSWVGPVLDNISFCLHSFFQPASGLPKSRRPLAKKAPYCASRTPSGSPRRCRSIASAIPWEAFCLLRAFEYEPPEHAAYADRPNRAIT